jgi:hypothetical protein
MKNRVEFAEDILSSINRIPFLKRFMYKDSEMICPFDYNKINEYLGYEYLNSESLLTSDSINHVLEEAEKRGDI